MEQTEKCLEEKPQSPPNYRNIHDSVCFYCVYLMEKQKKTLPPFKRYYCDLFKNKLYEAETFYYTCDAFLSDKK